MFDLTSSPVSKNYGYDYFLMRSPAYIKHLVTKYHPDTGINIYFNQVGIEFLAYLRGLNSLNTVYIITTTVFIVNVNLDTHLYNYVFYNLALTIVSILLFNSQLYLQNYKMSASAIHDAILQYDKALDVLLIK